MDLDRLNKLVAQWGNLVAAIAALVAAVTAIWTPLTTLNPWAWSWREMIFALIAVALVGVIVFRNRNAHRSRLADPEALRLNPQVPDQLVGRQEDLARLLNVLSNPLVFLVSESGCGKTTLLRAGVARDPSFTERFLPIYVDMSVLDWEDGPLRALREGFLRALPADERSKLGLDAQSGPKKYSEFFAGFYRRSQRRPLLLLDQFDDYQAQPRYRDRFFPPETHVWRDAEALTKENAFWRVIRHCLQSDVLTVIVACRDDAAAGLESFRFPQAGPPFGLLRLEPGFVRIIIDRLTERPAGQPPVIADPEGGWTMLRDRMVDELEARGQVLPQQLKVVIRGLSTLPRLTLAAYARAGRASGLEDRFVGSALQRAAKVSGLKDAEVLQLSLPLVDRARQPPDKGEPQSAAKLGAAARVEEPQARRALDQLQTDEILRPRETADGDETGWQLDHAYLAAPILRIERERDQWRLLLKERADAYAEAAWSRKWWGALLPIGEQARLLAARLRGQFRYGDKWPYALTGLVRFLPGIAGIGILSIAVLEAREWEAAPRIENQFADMIDSGTLSEDANYGLEELTSLGWLGRWRVSRDMFADPKLAEFFAAGASPILRGIVRLDPTRLDDLFRSHVTRQTLRESDPRIKHATAALIGAASVAALSDSTRTTFRGEIVEAAGQEPESVDWEAVVAGLGLLSAADPSPDMLPSLRGAIEKTNDPDQLSARAKAYAAVAGKVKEGDPGAAAELAALRGAIEKTGNSDQLSALAEAYAVVAGKVYAVVAGKVKDGDPGAAAELAALRGAIEKTGNSDQLSALAKAYAAVAAAAPSGVAASEDISTLLAGIPKLRSPVQCKAFAAALKAAAPHGRSPLSWKEAGLVYAAALLQPQCADEESTKQFVSDYQELLDASPGAPKGDWNGDLWAFAAWVRANLPGFDPHEPRVGFLNGLAAAGSDQK